MKTPAVFLLLLSLLHTWHTASAQGTSCQALGRVSFIVKNGGTCSTSLLASCSALSAEKVKVQNDIKSFFETAPCIPSMATATAKSVATAIASVWASSMLRISCTGSQVYVKGCGFGIGSGDAFSIAWAEAIAIAAAGAGQGNQIAFCVADIRALAPVMASAFASAQSQLCVSANGPVSALAFSNAAQSSIATAMVDAFASATAQFCGKQVSSQCTGNAGPSGPSSAGTSGHVSGGVDVDPTQGSGSSLGNTGGSAAAPLPACAAPIASCCSASSYPCTCLGCTSPVSFVTIEASPTGLPIKHVASGSYHCYCSL